MKKFHELISKKKLENGLKTRGEPDFTQRVHDPWAERSNNLVLIFTLVNTILLIFTILIIKGWL